MDQIWLNIEKLNGVNYMAWKRQVTSLLHFQGLDIETLLDEEESNTLRNNREKALRLIMITLSPECLKRHLNGEAINFKTFWNELFITYGPDSVQNLEYLSTAFLKLSLNTSKLSELGDSLKKFDELMTIAQDYKLYTVDQDKITHLKRLLSNNVHTQGFWLLYLNLNSYAEVIKTLQAYIAVKQEHKSDSDLGLHPQPTC